MKTESPRAQLIAQLRQIVGDEHVKTSSTAAHLYTYDASLAGGRQAVVVFPADTDQTAQVVGAVSRAGISLVARGFGTNLSGGSVLTETGVVVCLSRLNRILDICPHRRCARVQAGVINLEFQNALAAHGFFYAPDPASQKVSTLGGNVGENSGGPHCVKYGVTTNHVLGLTTVLADGQVVYLSGGLPDHAGLDLRGVMIGGEGTLGVVTEIDVRILPLPETVITMLAVYNQVADAARSVSQIMAAGLTPATLEMMDAPIIQAVEDSYACGYPRDAAAVLIIEVEGPAAGLSQQAEQIKSICRRNDCRDIVRAASAAERDRLWQGRRGAFGAAARLAPNFLVNDCTVPRSLLPQALEQVAAICSKHGFKHGNVFHAGDGNLHPLIFFDARDAHQLKRVKVAGHEIMQACVDLGGTISGEHGIGLEKMDAMTMIFSEDDLDAQRLLKSAFDPQHRLNPGKVLPTPDKQTDHQINAHITPDIGAAQTRIIEMVKQALNRQQVLRPTGNATEYDFGNSAQADEKPLSTQALDQVLAYDPDNQTIIVGAGMTLDRLQQILAEHGQWLPLRPPLAMGRHSLGGLTAMNAYGPECLWYGAPRDLLLGLKFVDGRGRLIRAGGRVMKNVAGYDMTRLMVGSAGTLGCITELTWRVAALPDQAKAITATGRLSDCLAAAATALISKWQPVSIALRQPDLNQWQLVIAVEGFGETVAAQLDGLASLFKNQGALKPAQPVAYDLYDGCLKSDYDSLANMAFVWRAHLPQDRLQTFIHESVNQLAGTPLIVDYGTGAMWAAMPDIDSTAWTHLCRRADLAGGHAMLVRAPADFKARHECMGLPQLHGTLITAVKQACDPDGIFSPGRLPRGTP